MKKNYFTALIAGSFLFLSSLHSCIHESLETEITNVQQDPVFYIKNEYMRGKDMVTGKLIQWEKVREYKHEGTVVLITVPVKNEGNRLIEELTFRIDNGKVSGHLWKFESNSDFTPSDYNLTAHEIMGKMTGKVSYTSLEGSMRYEKQIVRGEMIDEVAKSGSGSADAPACRACHDRNGGLIIGTPGNPIDTGPVVIPSPGGGGPTNPFPPDNPTIPIPGVIIIPNNPPGNDPCSKIKGQKGTAAYNQKISDLKGKTGEKKETGYSQKANGEFTYHSKASTNEGSNSLSLPDATVYKDVSGYMHTHVDNTTYFDDAGNEITRTGIKMFSPADVDYFMDMLANAQAAGRPLNDVYAVMVSTNSIYQIRFTGTAGQVKTFTDDQMKTFSDPYIKQMENSKNLASDFLKFLKDNMGIEGVNLYRMQQMGKTTEIKLGPDGKTKESDCP